MYLIADSGSTKTEWCVVRDTGEREIFRTSGINPVHLSEDHIGRVLSEELKCTLQGIDKIFFYGSGCISSERNILIERALSAFFEEVEQIEIASDLLAAARSLCGRDPGVCCILGTGSNSCFYDGKHIVKNVPPLGFILGDEGSGAVVGRKLLSNILKGICSKSVTALFFQEYPYTYAELMERIYRQPLPNRFLAELTTFIYRHIKEPELATLLLEAFDEFVERNLLQYPETGEYPVSFTGSMAFYFKAYLENSLQKYGLTLGKVTRSPMDELVDYHLLFSEH